MAAAHKHRIPDDSQAEAKPQPRPRRVKDAERLPAAPNPVAEHLLRLEDAFSGEQRDQTPPYPGKVRLAILVGAPLAAWVLIAGAAIGLRALF